MKSASKIFLSAVTVLYFLTSPLMAMDNNPSAGAAGSGRKVPREELKEETGAITAKRVGGSEDAIASKNATAVSVKNKMSPAELKLAETLQMNNLHIYMLFVEIDTQRGEFIEEHRQKVVEILTRGSHQKILFEMAKKGELAPFLRKMVRRAKAGKLLKSVVGSNKKTVFHQDDKFCEHETQFFRALIPYLNSLRIRIGEAVIPEHYSIFDVMNILYASGGLSTYVDRYIAHQKKDLTLDCAIDCLRSHVCFPVKYSKRWEPKTVASCLTATMTKACNMNYANTLPPEFATSILKLGINALASACGFEDHPVQMTPILKKTILKKPTLEEISEREVVKKLVEATNRYGWAVLAYFQYRPDPSKGHSKGPSKIHSKDQSRFMGDFLFGYIEVMRNINFDLVAIFRDFEFDPTEFPKNLMTLYHCVSRPQITLMDLIGGVFEGGLNMFRAGMLPPEPTETIGKFTNFPGLVASWERAAQLLRWGLEKATATAAPKPVAKPASVGAGSAGAGSAGFDDRSGWLADQPGLGVGSTGSAGAAGAGAGSAGAGSSSVDHGAHEPSAPSWEISTSDSKPDASELGWSFGTINDDSSSDEEE